MHGLHDFGCRDCPGMRETLQQWCEAEKMIAMSVGEVNCGELLAARDDPAQQSLRLLDREKSVHEDGISLAANERRRICHPHQLFLAGWQITSEAGAPYREHIPAQAGDSGFSCSHFVASMTICAGSRRSMGRGVEVAGGQIDKAGLMQIG